MRESTMAGALRRWCLEQQKALDTSRPGLRVALARVEGLPLVALTTFLVLLAVQLTTSHGDAGMFADAGNRMLRGDMDVFGASVLQVGPLYLLLTGLGSVLADALAAPHWAGAAVTTSLVSALLLTTAVRALVGSGRRALAALSVVGGGALAIPATYGHPEEAMTALLLVVATDQAYRRRIWAPALLLASAVTIKLWALVGVGLLLVAATRRTAVLRGLATGGAVCAAYLPFALLGHVATFHFAWQVELPAPLSLALPDGSAFGYRQRLLQVGVAAAVGALLAWRGRSPDVVWALPLAVMSVRLLLDPLSNPYYWTTLAVLVVLALVRRGVPLLEALLLAYVCDIVMLLLITTAQGRLGALCLSVLALAALSASLRQALGQPAGGRCIDDNSRATSEGSLPSVVTSTVATSR